MTLAILTGACPGVQRLYTSWLTALEKLNTYVLLTACGELIYRLMAKVLLLNLGLKEPLLPA